MNPYHHLHRHFIVKRQGLAGGLTGLFPGPTPSTLSQNASPAASSQSPGGIIGGITSLVGGITTDLPSSAASSASSTPLTQSSSSSTGSTTTARATTSASSSAPSTLPTSTTQVTTPTLTPAIVYTSSDGTSIVYITSTPPAASATGASRSSFLQDPSLEGGVFALVGIVILVLILVLITWTIRQRRRKRLERDLAAAVSFDPSATDLYEGQIEKHRLSGSSSGHGHGHGHDYGAPHVAYASQLEYHGPQSYGPYPIATYGPLPPNPSYQTPSPAVPQPVAQGGANLTRKFSDRKPVPPLLLDPANTHASVPPQFYQQ